jgi:hypothetical protein
VTELGSSPIELDSGWAAGTSRQALRWFVLVGWVGLHGGHGVYDGVVDVIVGVCGGRDRPFAMYLSRSAATDGMLSLNLRNVKRRKDWNTRPRLASKALRPACQSYCRRFPIEAVVDCFTSTPSSAGMRTLRSLPDDLTNVSYTTLCCLSRSLRDGRRAPGAGVPEPGRDADWPWFGPYSQFLRAGPSGYHWNWSSNLGFIPMQ